MTQVGGIKGRADLEEWPAYTFSSLKMSDFDRVIKLDANENPFGAGPKTKAALKNPLHWERYASQDELLPALADYVGVGPSHLVMGNGADEMIDLVMRTYLEPGDSIIDCPPSFEMYTIFARLNRARIISVERRDDMSVDIPAVERAVLREHPKILFITNPSNPDGSVTGREDLERLFALPVLVVVDEAYYEFYGESVAPSIPDRTNVIALRTFSKWAGLAGLRFGYAVAPAPVADNLLRLKPPYNVNTAALVAAATSIEDKDFLLGRVREIIAERERLALALERTGIVKPLPSQANFLLCQVLRGDGREIRRALAEQGIFIRTYSAPRLRGYIRISVGTPEQDDRLLAVLKSIVS